jgi:hypothetical protein
MPKNLSTVPNALPAAALVRAAGKSLHPQPIITSPQWKRFALGHQGGRGRWRQWNTWHPPETEHLHLQSQANVAVAHPRLKHSGHTHDSTSIGLCLEACSSPSGLWHGCCGSCRHLLQLCCVLHHDFFRKLLRPPLAGCTGICSRNVPAHQCHCMCDLPQV